ncbi:MULTISPECIES: D-2-hydroxyacid dehydrogenase [Bacillus]|uniref:D-2-hydroxyacid dehydrogenase n=1 Tax=Bacillus TaxID=1386 RepID=UPI000BB7901E|nr:MULTISPECIES: D-2-hydroxyacid dehydrogenase [Bacillus]
MVIENILVAGIYEEQFNRQLPNETNHNYRFIPLEKITIEDLKWADVYVGSKPCENFNLKHLNWVHTFNAGVNNFLEIRGWEQNKILLTRTVSSFGQRISEYCLSYILKDLQLHTFFAENQHYKKWIPKTPKMIKDMSILVYGTGEIGQEVARTFSYFGAEVHGVSQSGKQKEHFRKIVKVEEASSFVEKADWIISTLPLTKDTKELFNKRFFENMNGASFINVGRGATVDELALIEALNNGNVAHAVLDVLTTEPLPEQSELWSREDVTITPHISAVTEIGEAIACFLDTLERIENNLDLINSVDFSRGY